MQPIHKLWLIKSKYSTQSMTHILRTKNFQRNFLKCSCVVGMFVCCLMYATSNEITDLREKYEKLETKLKDEQERLMNELSQHEKREHLLSQQLEDAQNVNKKNVQLRSEMNNMQQKLKDSEMKNTSMMETTNKKKYDSM